MHRRRILRSVLSLAIILPGCVYYNGLYNAKEAFEAAERASLQGDPITARAGYEAAVEGAERAWIAEPEGGWADDALLLAARAALRLGDPTRAREALDLLDRDGADPEVLRRARILEGAIEVGIGRGAEAIERILPVLGSESSSLWLGEGHLWLARARFGVGQIVEGHLELDRAVEVNPDLRRAVALERLGYAIEQGDRGRAGRSAILLFRETKGAAWADSIEALAGSARRSWGPLDAAALLAPLRDGSWQPEARDRLLLARVQLLLSAGDSTAAAEELEWIARGSGERAVDARVQLADVQLALATTFTELVLVRRVLLPIASDPRGYERMLHIGEVEVLAGWGTQGDPVAFFAAGEVARDELGADRLARALFLTAAESDLEGPWSSKALLAVLALADEPQLQVRIRQRLANRRRDPYAERIQPGYTASELHELWETELTFRVRELRVAATEEARRYITLGEGETPPTLSSTSQPPVQPASPR